MSGLERQAHRLVELARAGDEPTAAQLMRLQGHVAARLAAQGSLGAGTTGAVTRTFRSSLLFKSFAAAATVALGSAAVYALGSEPEPARPPPAPAMLAPAVRAGSVGTSARPAQQPALEPRPEPPSPALRNVKSTPSLRLQEEAALLAEVQGALRSGSSKVALAKLESYDRKFPTGMLRAEADAAKVFALCSAGSVEKARSAAARFVQRYPTAPATARVQAACK